MKIYYTILYFWWCGLATWSRGCAWEMAYGKCSSDVSVLCRWLNFTAMEQLAENACQSTQCMWWWSLPTHHHNICMNKATTTTTKTTMTLTNGTVFNPVFIVVIVIIIIIIIIKNTALCSSLVADRKRRQGSPAELSIVFQFKGNVSSKAMKQINI